MSYLSAIGLSKKVSIPKQGINNSNQQFGFIQIYCRAVGCTSCTIPGQKHICHNCGNQNSDHRTRNCPIKHVVINSSDHRIIKRVVINGVLYNLH